MEVFDMVSELKIDSYSWWRQALLGEFGPMYENDPQCGYYRMRKTKGGPWVPVAIWAGEGVSGLICLVSGAERDPYEVWTWVCRYPVPYETYVAVAERGAPWPEDLPELKRLGSISEANTTVTRSSFVDQRDHSLAAPTLGHNSSGVAEAEGFLEEILVIWQSAEVWLEGVGTVSSQMEADKAANYAERFSNLETRAEEARTLEKRPILEEGRRIDAKWKPVIAQASEGKIRMKKALEAYLLAERERRLLNANGSEIEPPRAGTSGRRIGLRSRQVLTVSDQNLLDDHYRADPRIWSEKSVRDLVHKYAEGDLVAGLAIPGATLIEEFSAA
ncbi:MAG: hypothetical protein ACKOBC_04415 [Hyphomicrobiales bacterium]